MFGHQHSSETGLQQQWSVLFVSVIAPTAIHAGQVLFHLPNYLWNEFLFISALQK